MKANTTKPNLDTPAPAPERMPAFSTSTCMSLLWQKASRHMHPHELEWLADDAAEQAAVQARALSEVLDDLSCLVNTDDGGVGSFQTRRSTFNLLQNIHHQLDTIAALADIGADASFRVQLALKGGVQ